MRNHEVICVFYKNQCTYNPQMTSGQRKVSYKRKGLQTDVYGQADKDYIYDSAARYPRSIQVFSTDTQKSSLHPTQKPVALLEYLIMTYTNENDIVLDNCMGSGSTCIAAQNTNRKYIGIELDDSIFNIAKERLKRNRTQLQLF
jgi:site-specific DNA-methyltransferase (adenine-specific)